ncbi:MAG: hypothetical protein ACAF41_14670 [Leptolyngbya sp. BL-A-14]
MAVKGSMLEFRLDSIKQLEGKHKLLIKHEVISSINELLIYLFVKKTNPKLEKDFSNAQRIEVISFLEALEAHNQIVNVYWVSAKEGIQILFQEFRLNYDELWLPGADDLLIENVDKTWILQMHHEEVFSFYQREVDPT